MRISSRFCRHTDTEYTEGSAKRFNDTVKASMEMAGIAPSIFIETGTLYGDRTCIAQALFNEVLTIELSDKFYRGAQKRFGTVDNVTCFHGDSAAVLPRLLECLRQQSLFFWLDAHHCFLGVDFQDRKDVAKSFPLWGELDAIDRRDGVADIVYVDDRHNHNKSAEWLKNRKNPGRSKLHKLQSYRRLHPGYCDGRFTFR